MHLIRAAEDLNSVDDAIVRNLDVVLVATMSILYKLHQQLKDSPFGGDQSRQQKMQELRAKARSLMMFAGMVRSLVTLAVCSTLTLHCSETAAVPVDRGDVQPAHAARHLPPLSSAAFCNDAYRTTIAV